MPPPVFEFDLTLEPATEALLGQMTLFRSSVAGQLAMAGADQEGWNVRVLLVAYELAVARGLRPVELTRLTASDVSLSRGVLLLRNPKATRRGADPRLLPLGPTLLCVLAPLVEGLRRSGQDGAPLLTTWTDGGLRPASAAQLSRQARVSSGSGATLFQLGQGRHLHLQLLEALEHRAGRGAASYALQRSRSAAAGHAQSGGWSRHLGVDPVVLREVMDRLDRYLEWTPVPTGRAFRPPAIRPRPRQHLKLAPAPGRSGSDWATSGLEQPGVELDLLAPAHDRLWGFRWTEVLPFRREQALATALLVQLVAFGELLAPSEALERLTWDDLDARDGGVLLSLALPGASGRLRVWLGAAERLLFRRLRAAGATRPFADVRMDLLDPLLAWLFGRPVDLEQLQRANRLAHLATHPPDVVGYLAGEVSHKLLAPPERPARSGLARSPDPLFQPLLGRLRQRADALTAHDLDRELDAALPGWRDWPVDDGGRLTPGLVVETLRQCCGATMRNRRRSRSPATLRALLHELCRLQTVLGRRPAHELTRPDLELALAGRRAQSRLNSAVHWLGRTCRRRGLQPPRRLRVDEGQVFTTVTLPGGADVYAVADSYQPRLRPLVLLLLLCCCIARKAEIGRLRVGDVLVDEHVLLIDIRHSKGGRAAQRRLGVPLALRSQVPAIAEHLRSRSAPSRLLEPLACRSSTADAVFQRLSYRLAVRGIHWTPHMMRAIASTEARQAGVDPAEISRRLGHKLVATTTTHYIALDPLDIQQRALTLAGATPLELTSRAIAFLFQVSLRRAEDMRRATAGVIERLMDGPVQAAARSSA